MEENGERIRSWAEALYVVSFSREQTRKRIRLKGLILGLYVGFNKMNPKILVKVIFKQNYKKTRILR